MESQIVEKAPGWRVALAGGIDSAPWLAIAWFFLGEAWSIVNSWDGTVTMMQMRHVQLAAPLLVIALVVMVLGGLSVALGFHTRHGAVLLFGFTIVVSIVMHDYWKLGQDADRRESAWTGMHDENGQEIDESRDDYYAWSAAFISRWWS